MFLNLGTSRWMQISDHCYSPLWVGVENSIITLKPGERKSALWEEKKELYGKRKGWLLKAVQILIIVLVSFVIFPFCVCMCTRMHASMAVSSYEHTRLHPVTGTGAHLVCHPHWLSGLRPHAPISRSVVVFFLPDCHSFHHLRLLWVTGAVLARFTASWGPGFP